jgi:spermidine synthase
VSGDGADRAARPEPRALARSLYLLALLSGAAALTYEVTWAKLLSLTFGRTTLAASAVVGGFLGGMGIGAWLYHWVQERVGRPLLIYGAIETGIALSAAGLTIAFESLPGSFAALARGIPTGLPMNLVRVVSVFLLLLVPAALMGATFPALCTSLIRSRREVDRHLGMIYGLNTLGGALGALAAGLLLIQALGLRGSVLAGNALNLLVGLAALLLARRFPEEGGSGGAPSAATAIPTALPFRLTGAVILLSGFATLGYEILWFRALRYLVGNSTFALTIVLVVFLLGLGFGALLLRRVIARGQPELDLARCQLGIAVLGVLAIGIISALVSSPQLAGVLTDSSRGFRALPWWLRLLLHGGVSMLLMLPATLLMGLTFPLASRLFLGDLRRLGRRVGGAYLLSNIGSTLGAVLAAMAILPLLGTVAGTRWLAALNLMLGVALLFGIQLSAFKRFRIAAQASLALLVLVLILPERIHFMGLVTAHLPGVSFAFEEEDDLGTVQVLEDRKQPSYKGMAIDGTLIGASRGWNFPVYSKQILIAHLPMLLDARIRSALQIGLGSASTLDALASHPTLDRIDCVEINPAVVRGSRLFQESRVFEDPRVRVIVEDAMHLLLRSPEVYDAVVSDGKQNAEMESNWKLSSHEFYRLALSRLNEHGLFVQWIPVQSLGSDFRIILRTAAEVFPALDLFYDPPSSVILVGGRHPLVGRPRMSRASYQELRIESDLRRLLIPEAGDLLRRWIAGREQILESVGAGPLNSWDRAPLEFAPYRAGAEELARAGAENVRLLVSAYQRARPLAPAEFRAPDEGWRRATELVHRASMALQDEDTAAARELARQALVERPGHPMAVRMLRMLPAVRKGSERAAEAPSA